MYANDIILYDLILTHVSEPPIDTIKGDEALLEAGEARGGVGEGTVVWILVQNDKGVGFLEEVVVGPPEILPSAITTSWPDLATLGFRRF